MNEHNTIDSDPGLIDPDLLLLLLDSEAGKNEDAMELLSNQVFNQETYVANQQRVEQLIAKLNRDHKSFSRRWLFVFALLIIGGGAMLFVLKTQPSSLVKQPEATMRQFSYNMYHQSTTIQQQQPEKQNQNRFFATTDTLKNEQTDTAKPIRLYTSVPTRWHLPEEFGSFVDDVPVLSDAEIKQTAKDKLRMLRDVVRKKTTYALLPMGKTKINQEEVSFMAFRSKTAEVTNLEYRTFLNDLLIQGRTDDYLLAKPVALGWTKAGVPEYEVIYFTSPAYNEFPAVNMTRKGAELFCEWMTTEFRKAVAKGDVKWSGGANPKFRLPYETEWIYAARGCDTSALQYPWGRYSSQVWNTSGCYLCNFNYSASKAQLEGQNKLGANSHCVSTKSCTHTIVTTAGRSIDTLLMAPVFSYNPNARGLYCTLGNAAEMVWAKSSTSEQPIPRAMGGAWSSPVDEVKIESSNRFDGQITASASIGFRPVLVWD